MPYLDSLTYGTIESQEEALGVLANCVFVRNRGTCVKLDYEERDNWEVHGPKERGLYCRLVAAVNYQRLGDLEDAEFGYARAATLAEKLGFVMASIRCRIRAAQISKKRADTARSIPEKKEHLRQLELTGLRIVHSVTNASLAQLVD